MRAATKEVLIKTAMADEGMTVQTRVMVDYGVAAHLQTDMTGGAAIITPGATAMTTDTEITTEMTIGGGHGMEPVLVIAAMDTGTAMAEPDTRPVAMMKMGRQKKLAN